MDAEETLGNSDRSSARDSEHSVQSSMQTSSDTGQIIRRLRDRNWNLDAELERAFITIKNIQAERARLEERLSSATSSLEQVTREKNALRNKITTTETELAELECEKASAIEHFRGKESSLRATIQILNNKMQIMPSQLSSMNLPEAPSAVSIQSSIQSKIKQIPAGGPNRGRQLEEIELIELSGLFDAEFYVNRFPDVALSEMEPLVHYVLHGAAEGRDPHPLFDSAYYLSQCPAVDKSKANPLVHYLREGFKQYDPNPLFQNSYYRQQCPKLTTNDLVHYIRHGAAEGINTCILFDTRYYLATNHDVEQSGINPLAHYLLAGAYEGRSPHPLFDPAYYLRKTKTNFLPRFPLEEEAGFSVAERFYSNAYLICEGHSKPPRRNPLVHLLKKQPKEGPDPHPLFSAKFYLQKYDDVVGDSQPPFLHYLTNGRAELRQPHPLFDPYYYLEQHPDLIDNEVDLLTHYVTQGAKDGDNPNAYFDTSFYLKSNPTVESTNQNPLIHFVTSGAPQGRSPNSHFDPVFYSTTYGDVAEAGLDAFTHYVIRGVHESRARNRIEYEQMERRLPKAASARTKAKIGPTFATINGEPDASIIIPIYGQLSLTMDCLQSLSAHKSKYSFEVVVVDDASPDNSFDKLSQIPGLTIIRAKENGGFVRSCNLGASIARGHYLVFLNNDTEVMPNWLDELLNTFEMHPNAGLVGSQLIYPNGRLQEAGSIIYQDGSAANFGRNDDFTKPEYNYVRSVDYCSGASLAINRKLFVELGQFDEHYIPGYCEDVDIAFRARQAGFDVLFQPLSKAIHKEGGTSGTDITSGAKANQVANLEKIKQRWHAEISTHPYRGTRPYFERDRNDGPRVLIIDLFTPTPDQDAGSALTYEWIENLKSWGYRCTYVPAGSFVHAGKYTENLQRMGVKCIYPPHFSNAAAFLESVEDVFDLVLIFRVTIFDHHIEAVKRYCPSAKILFHTIDLHHLRYQREAEIDETEESRLKALEWKIKEEDAIKQSDCAIVVSSAEKEILTEQLPDSRIEVIPLSAKLEPIYRDFSLRKDLLFIGGFGHPPNVDAVLYFVESILPLVQKKIPDIRFFIIGSKPPESVRELANLNVLVTGHVNDLTKYFGHCRLSVAPLRTGAGMKGKVLTSLAYGLPCICTPVAAEGIGLKDGANILIASSPEEFSEKVVELYTNSETWSKLAANGMEFIQNNYSPEHNKAILGSILKDFGLPTESMVPKAIAANSLEFIAT